MKLRQALKAVMITSMPFQAEAASFLRLSGYFNDQETPDATITAGTTALPLGLKAFTFTNFGDNLIYGEYSLSKKIADRAGLAVEYNRDFLAPRTGLIE